MSNSLRPHESQHARPPYPSPSPGVHSDSHPSSPWYHPAISSSVVPFSSLPPVPPSIRVFSNESTLRMRWPKYWSFSFSISPSKEHPGLISFTMDWLDLLAWVWKNSRSWWWTGRPGMLCFMGSQSWTWLSNWTEGQYNNSLATMKHFLKIHKAESAIHVPSLLRCKI